MFWSYQIFTFHATHNFLRLIPFYSWELEGKKDGAVIEGISKTLIGRGQCRSDYRQAYEPSMVIACLNMSYFYFFFFKQVYSIFRSSNKCQK